MAFFWRRRWLWAAAVTTILAGIFAGELPSRRAVAQGGSCTPGTDCCVVGASTGDPRRYAVACDGGAQTASGAAMSGGYPTIVYGPTTFDDAGAWMAAANVPGWEQYAATPPAQAAPALPAPVQNCAVGQNCCYVGASNEQPPRYAIGYDGGTGSGSHSLAASGYTSILFGPVSTEACHAWWNDNIAVGIGQNFPPAPAGAVPFAPGTFAGQGPKPSSACTLGQNCCYVGVRDMLIGQGTATRQEYAIAYDGGSGSGSNSLMSSGYRIAYGPVSIEACHGWWNDNIAAQGLAQPFPQGIAGTRPFPPGAFSPAQPAYQSRPPHWHLPPVIALTPLPPIRPFGPFGPRPDYPEGHSHDGPKPGGDGCPGGQCPGGATGAGSGEGLMPRPPIPDKQPPGPTKGIPPTKAPDPTKAAAPGGPPPKLPPPGVVTAPPKKGPPPSKGPAPTKAAAPVGPPPRPPGGVIKAPPKGLIPPKGPVPAPAAAPTAPLPKPPGAVTTVPPNKGPAVTPKGPASATKRLPPLGPATKAPAPVAPSVRPGPTPARGPVAQPPRPPSAAGPAVVPATPKPTTGPRRPTTTPTPPQRTTGPAPTTRPAVRTPPRQTRAPAPTRPAAAPRMRRRLGNV